MKLFTKSAFKQALFCPESLHYYYHRDLYANQNDEDDFLQALADGGNQVGDLAKVYFDIQPEADLSSVKGYDESVQRTKELFLREDVDIAEAAFRWKDCFVRADIIEKKGSVINLIEVKAKSWDPDEDRLVQKRNSDKVNTGILEYVYDVAFQQYVIRNALGPNYTVKAFLMLADKSVVADYDGINQLFHVVKKDGHTEIERQSGAEELREHNHVLTLVDVNDLCNKISEGRTQEQKEVMGCNFVDFVNVMSASYVNDNPQHSPLGSKCFKCPFYSNEKTPGKKDGKRECWTKKAGYTDDDFKKPQVADLWGAYIKRDIFIAKGKYKLEDLSAEDFGTVTKSGPGLHHIERKLLQIGLATKNGSILSDFKKNLHGDVYVDVPGLRDEMKAWKYPLHMIDFETTAVALPMYKGLRPYEQVAFQFSHHSIQEDGTIRHEGQYLNTAMHHFPNFEFVRKLKDQLNEDDGTIFRYAAHENTILRAIHKQLSLSDEKDKDELMAFIDSITHYNEGRTRKAGPRDMVDLLDLVKKYYYHPDMKGSNSIKAVLPAILNSSEALQKKYSRPIYGSDIESQNFKADSAKAWITYGPDGTVENPYKQLEAIASFLDVTEEELETFDAKYTEEDSINNGGAALAAYTKLQFGSDVEVAAIKEALLRYCELDTMSMVFLWEYFREMTA